MEYTSEVTSGLLQTLGRRRKTRRQWEREHDLFLQLTQEGKTSLEVLQILGLSKAQLDKHCLHAFRKKELNWREPAYHSCRARTLPRNMQDLLGVEGDVLVKLEKCETGVLVSVLANNPKIQE